MSPSAPQLQPLSQTNRRLVFLSMLALFSILVPVLVLYATGYRFNWMSTETSFRIVGGMYITNSAEDTEIIVNGEPVQNMRIFQRAAYIQNVPAGLHEVYVEGDGLTTWVKNLPVFAQLVTEARSFNLPVVPNVRVITQWVDPVTSAGVLFEPATSTPFSSATTTSLLIATTSTATSTYSVNNEYVYVASLFASSTATSSDDTRQGLDFGALRSTISSATTSVEATTTKRSQDVMLFERDGEVFARWMGEDRRRPYYYCVNYQDATTTAQLYGEHVFAQLYVELASSTDFTVVSKQSQTLCRSTIRIDRIWQEVKMFDFVPGTTDLVLMHLTNGLYVVEIDDRSWQNVQLLYPGTNIEVVLDGQTIYVKQDEYFLQVFADITN
jgi:hypothetical protein